MSIRSSKPTRRVTRLDRWLKRHGACPEAQRWAKGKTLKQAWLTCDEAEWMNWFCYKALGFDRCWRKEGQIDMITPDAYRAAWPALWREVRL
jgi:hypothetical protein